jgi:hypothetical protein
MVWDRDTTRTILQPDVTAALPNNNEAQSLQSLTNILAAEVPWQLLVTHPPSPAGFSGKGQSGILRKVQSDATGNFVIVKVAKHGVSHHRL